MVLDVLAVGDVGGIASELGRERSERAQRRGAQRSAVAAHPQHEVRRLQQIDVLIAGEGAVVTLLALGVETPPPEPPTQINLVDTVESVPGVDVLDPFPHIERGVIELQLFIGVERLPVPERPLALAAGLAGLSHLKCAPVARALRNAAAAVNVTSGGADPAASWGSGGRSTGSGRTATAASWGNSHGG